MSSHGHDTPIHAPETTREPIGRFHPAYILATWFWLGKIPFMPGTWGSLGALPVAYAIHTHFGAQMLLIAALVFFLVGVAATEIYMTANNTDHDSSEIVIDEVAGQWLLLTIFAPTLQGYAIGFVLFRLLDILKPWPISLLDRHVPGAFGVMIDDFAAGALPIVLFFGFILFCAIFGYTDLAGIAYKILGFHV